LNSEWRFPSDKTFVIAEIGINHNGDVEIAKQLIDVAAQAGCDAAKFQIRTPHMSLPPELWNVMRETPWGEMMTYLEYRQKIELSPRDYQDIVAHCAKRNILFSASPWDLNAADKLYAFGAPFVKVASASVTNIPLLQHIAGMGKPVVMSTGMSTFEQVQKAYDILSGVPQLGMLVCTSTYPAKPEDLHLERINTLREAFPEAVIGYSGHEPGLWTTLCAVAMGARIVERHITLDRAMKGSDQGASVEPNGIKLLVREIRNFEKARGSGAISVQACELKDMERLRGKQNSLTGAQQDPLCAEQCVTYKAGEACVHLERK